MKSIVQTAKQQIPKEIICSRPPAEPLEYKLVGEPFISPVANIPTNRTALTPITKTALIQRR